MVCCDQCGACCRGHLIVEADDLDVLREPLLISADPEYAGRSPDDVVRELQSDVGYCIALACGAPCPFLVDNRCSIYPTRPNACVGMQAGDEQCQMARREEGIAAFPRCDG